MRVMRRVSRRKVLIGLGMDNMRSLGMVLSRVCDRVPRAGGAASLAFLRVWLRVLRAGVDGSGGVVVVASRWRRRRLVTVTGVWRVVGTTLGAGAGGCGVFAVMDRVIRRLGVSSVSCTLGTGVVLVRPCCCVAVWGGTLARSSGGGAGVVAATIVCRSRYSCVVS